MRITRLILKIGFIILAVLLQLSNDVEYFQSTKKSIPAQPVKNGLYEVAVYVINKDSLPLRLSDTLRWQDVIFENGSGSIKTADTAFRQRYKRAYFTYTLDSATHTLAFKKQPADSLAIVNLHFDFPDSNTVRLWGRQRTDSLYVVLKRMNHHFQLAEKQFHWLSEYNR